MDPPIDVIEAAEAICSVTQALGKVVPSMPLDRERRGGWTHLGRRGSEIYGLPGPAGRAETDIAAWTVRDVDVGECAAAAVAIFGRAEVRTLDLRTAEGGTA